MSESTDPAASPANAPRERLDAAILGFNRHALLVERHRAALAAHQASVAHFELLLAQTRLTQAQLEVAAQGRERWRAERAATAAHRELIQRHIGSYVTAMRGDGVTPERALIAVRERLRRCVTPATPDAPAHDAHTLAADVGKWVIDAYFQAA